MKNYSIYDAKAKLSELIRLVQTSGPVIITDRGTPVVKVCPIEDSKNDLKTHLDHMELLGLLKPALRKKKSALPIAKIPGSLKRFLDSRK